MILNRHNRFEHGPQHRSRICQSWEEKMNASRQSSRQTSSDFEQPAGYCTANFFFNEFAIFNLSSISRFHTSICAPCDRYLKFNGWLGYMCKAALCIVCNKTQEVFVQVVSSMEVGDSECRLLTRSAGF